MTLSAAPEALATTTVAVSRRPPRRKLNLGWSTYVALGWLALVMLAAIAGPWLPLPDPNAPEPQVRLEGPSAAHWMGTDALGRDILSRIVAGAQATMTISVFAVALGVVVGGGLGIIAGYFRGWAERVIMTCNNILLAFPAIVLLMVVLTYVGRSVFVITLVVGLISIPVYTRVARANTLSVAEREFVRASRTLGAKDARILLRDILPNVVGPLLAFAFIAMGTVVVVEGTLAFLGLSVAAPAPTWGGMIYEGKNYLADAPHFVFLPALVMFLTVLSLNFVGDALRSRNSSRGSKL